MYINQLMEWPFGVFALFLPLEKYIVHNLIKK